MIEETLTRIIIIIIVGYLLTFLYSVWINHKQAKVYNLIEQDLEVSARQLHVLNEILDKLKEGKKE